MADVEASGRALDPQAFMQSEIKRLNGAKMNHGKRRRLIRQWRDWSVKIARTHR